MSADDGFGKTMFNGIQLKPRPMRATAGNYLIQVTSYTIYKMIGFGNSGRCSCRAGINPKSGRSPLWVLYVFESLTSLSDSALNLLLDLCRRIIT